MFKCFLSLLLITLSIDLAAETKILAFAGSTRADSVNQKLIQEAAAIGRSLGASVTLINLRDYSMPFYDGDLETNQGMPSAAKELRQLMIKNDVIIIASPEYNGSVSAVLKNVLDWASRSETGAPSRDAFKNKKFILLSASPSPAGGSRGLIHLKAIIENVGGSTLSSNFSLPNAYQAFDKENHLVDSNQKAALKQLIESSLKK